MPSTNTDDSAMRFLVIEQDPPAFRHLQICLMKEFGERCCVTQAENGKNAITLLRQQQYDVIFAESESLKDLFTEAENGLTKICRLAETALVVAISSGGSISSAVEAMRAGAHDYMAKPINISAFSNHIAELGQRHGHIKALSIGQKPCVHAQFEGFVGASAQMEVIYEQIERIAPSSAPVFITGESGTGKELCAEALHQRGPRADKPFIAINCSAIPRDLMEAEIFGVVRGAYTGADRDRPGAAEMAEGGILFLDEIGELDLGLQAKLLRFLQTGTISRVGEAVSRTVDVRIICATNRNPMQLIAEKKFREDLFYRLHVLPIHLPPLRQRPADILALAQAFLTQYAKEEGKEFSSFCTETANLIVGRDWPGNVRQLQNLIRRVVVMFEGTHVSAHMIEAADIETRSVPVGNSFSLQVSPHPASIEPMWVQEQKIIETAIARFAGNVTLAAAALEISPSTIYRKKQVWEQMQQEVASAIVA